MKKSGEGLHILWEIISKGIEYRWKHFRNWWNLPPKCLKHGREHLYQHGWDNLWDCAKCRKEFNPDWMSKREDYLK